MLNTANWAARLNELASETRVPGALRIDPEAGVAACLLTNSAESETLYREVFNEVFGALTGHAACPVNGPVQEWFRTHGCDIVMTLSGRVSHSLNRAEYLATGSWG